MDDDFSLPRRVGPYRLKERLGGGDWGALYRAYDERLERHVAVRHVRPGDALGPAAREHLRRETRAIASLDAAVQIYDIIERDEGDWIVMELAEGRTLQLSELIDHLLVEDTEAGAADVVEELHRLTAPEIGAVDEIDEAPEVDTVDEIDPMDEAGAAGESSSGSSESASLRGPQSSTSSTIVIRTLLAIDLRGIGRLTEQFGEARSYQVVARHDRLVRDLLARHNGHEIHKSENFLLIFDRPIDAVRFALAYHELLEGLLGEALLPEKLRLEARLGIHLGEVLLRENPPEDVDRGAQRLEVEGSAKLVATGLAALAPAGQTLITQEACEIARRAGASTAHAVPEFAHREHGVFELRGIEESVQVHEVTPSGPMPPVFSTGPGEPGGSGSRRVLAWPRLALALVPAVLLGLAAAWYFRLGKPPVPDSGQRPAVAVLGFSNLGDPTTDWLSTALREMLSTELAAGDQLRLIPGESVSRMKTDLALADADSLAPDTLRRIRRVLGVDYVILGSYLLVGSEGERLLRLQLHIQDTGRGESLSSLAETGPEARLFELVSQAGADVRRDLGVAPATVAANAAIRATLPAVPGATRLYAEGLAMHRRFNRLTARDLLREAIELAPDYALAHAALAEVQLELGFDREATASARRAYELAARLPRAEYLWIEGLYYMTAGDPRRAIGSYEALWRFSSDQIEHGLRLADAQITAGLVQAARDTLAALSDLPAPQRDDPRIDLLQARLAYWLVDRPEALQAAERANTKARRLESPTLMADALLLTGNVLQNSGHLDEASAALDEARRLFQQVGDRAKAAEALRAIGTVYDRQGDLARAEEVLATAVDTLRQSGGRAATAHGLNNLAYVLLERGRLRSALELIEEAFELAGEIGNRHEEAWSLDTMAWILIHRGELARAEELARRSGKIYAEIGSEDVAWSFIYLGTIALERGNLAAAQSHFDALLGQEELEPGESALAYRQAGLGHLDLVRGELAKAEQRFGAARTLRERLQDRETIAESDVDRLRWLLETGYGDDAVELGSSLAARCAEDGRVNLETEAKVHQARALIAIGELETAREILSAALEKARTSEDPRLPLTAGIAWSRLLLALGKTAEAHDEIAAIHRAAEELVLMAPRLEAELAYGEIELAVGEEAGGRRRLARLVREAEGRGYFLIARKAQTALGD